MASHENFRNIVIKGWNTNVPGSVMHKVWFKLKGLKPDLKTLNVKNFAHVSEQVDKARATLVDVQSKL